MKRLLRIIFEYRFVKTQNVVYQYQNLSSRENPNFEDGSVVFVDRCFAMDIPKTGEAIIYNGNYFRVATVWHNKDSNCIEVDLNDL